MAPRPRAAAAAAAAAHRRLSAGAARLLLAALLVAAAAPSPCAGARVEPAVGSLAPGWVALLAQEGEETAWQRAVVAGVGSLTPELQVSVLDYVSFRYKVAFSTGGRDIVLWGSLRNGGGAVFRNHQQDIVGIGFFPAGDRAISWSIDKTAVIFETWTGTVRCTLHHARPLIGAVVFPQGDLVMTLGIDDRARVWEASSGWLRHELHLEDLWGARLFPSGGRAVFTTRGKAVVADPISGKTICDTRDEEDHGVFLAEPLPTGDRFATVSNFSHATVWDAETCERLVSLGPADWSSGLTVSSVGDLVATTDRGAVSVWDTRSGERLHFLVPPGADDVEEFNAIDSPLFTVQFFPQDTRVVALSARAATVWDAATGRMLLELRSAARRFESLAVSPGGDTLVTCGIHEVVVWDSVSGARLRTLMDRDGSTAVATGSTLVTCRVAVGMARSFDPRGVGRGMSVRQAWRALLATAP